MQEEPAERRLLLNVAERDGAVKMLYWLLDYMTANRALIELGVRDEGLQPVLKLVGSAIDGITYGGVE